MAARALRSGSGLAAFAIALLCASRADASPSARLVYLRGRGAEACPDEQALRAAVASRLGYDPFFPWAPNTVFVEIVRSNGAWHAQVKLVDEDNRLRGERELRVAKGDCTAAVDAMALSISLAIDPASLVGPPRPLEEKSEPAPPPAPEPAPPPPEPAPPPPEARPTPPPAESIHVDAGLGASVVIGAAPAPSVAALAFVGARLAWFSATLEGRGDLVSGALEDRGAYVRSSQLAASLVPCVHGGVVFACALATAGVLHATSAVAAPRDDDTGFFALGARAGVLVPLGGALSLRVHVEVVAPVSRATLQVDRADVYTVAPLSASAGGALVVRFR